MKKKNSKLIPFKKIQWKGKEVDARTDRIIVRLKKNKGEKDSNKLDKTAKELAKLFKGASVKRCSRKTGITVLNIPEGIDVVQWCKELAEHSEVVYAQPDTVTKVLLTPNDPQLGDQWPIPMINAFDAWDLETGSTDVMVAVLDTGISHDGSNLTHPDLNDASRFLLGTDFVNDDALPIDGHGHGTHVAGTIGAETDNNDGISGINWTSQIYVCKVFDDNGFGSESDFEAAVEEAVDFAIDNNKRLIINLSAGWFSDNQTIRDACEYVDDNGMVLVVATGNESGALRTPAIHSANYNSVIAVGATDSADNVASFSNVGPAVSVVAPGDAILSTFPTYNVNGDTVTDYVEWDGTSMATPHVAGLASLVWSREERLNSEQIRDVIQNTAQKLGAGNFNENWGFGRIQADEAVSKAGWELTPVQTNLNFVDIPENETQLRAIRIDVNSFHATEFEVSVDPTAPFELHNFSGSVSLGKTTDYDTPRSAFIWIRYTGTNAGDLENGTARIRCVTTDEEFDVSIQANTIARPTCAMILTLDQSGSMGFASGMDSLTREQVLKYSSGIFLDFIRENNGLGLVTFDHDAYDLLNPIAGPFGAADDAFDPARSDANAALASYSYNPNGATAIGDGIEKAHNNLASVSGYDKKAIIVFTDGHETASKRINEVASMIDEQVFAVGLGTASQLNPAALDEICNNTGGYLLLTDTLDNDDTFKLAKYFLQIQAGVNNEDVVVDPTGYVAPNQVVKIPFMVNETDISIDTILMTPFNGVIDYAVETPNGDFIHAGNLTEYPTVSRSDGKMLSYYRLTMPVINNMGKRAQNGEWNIVLRINEKYWSKYLGSLDNYPKLYKEAIAHGAKYTALVHAYSNLRMKCTKGQSSYEPGGTINIRTVLTEYGIPLNKKSSVRANLKMPDGSTSVVVFDKVSSGIYEANVPAKYNGIYTFVIKAKGKTSRNQTFTREKVMTAAVWKGGDNITPGQNSDPSNNPTKEALCKLLECLRKTSKGAFDERMKEYGINLKALSKCFCADEKRIN